MEKHIYDEKNGLHYTLDEDGYYYPDLALPQAKNDYIIGKYGRMRKRYLKNHKKSLYTNLLTSGKLYEHLKEVDTRATVQVRQIVTAMAKADGTDEKLKATDQMKWVSLMNNYKACAEEIVLEDVVFNNLHSATMIINSIYKKKLAT